MPSSRHEEIRVRLMETDGIDEVVILKRDRNEVSAKPVKEKLVRKESHEFQE
jgi:hypothetical protein